MDSKLRPCDPDETLQSLGASVEVLLFGVSKDACGFLSPFPSREDRKAAWASFVESTLSQVGRLSFQAYEAAVANRLEDVLALASDADVSSEAAALSESILRASAGARHERLLSRLAKEAAPVHPCVALAVKAAAFNEPAAAAQVAYFYQEWRASSASLPSSSLSAFLESQPAAVLTLSPEHLADPNSPFLVAAAGQPSQGQQDKQHG